MLNLSTFEAGDAVDCFRNRARSTPIAMHGLLKTERGVARPLCYNPPRVGLHVSYIRSLPCSSHKIRANLK